MAGWEVRFRERSRPIVLNVSSSDFGKRDVWKRVTIFSVALFFVEPPHLFKLAVQQAHELWDFDVHAQCPCSAWGNVIPARAVPELDVGHVLLFGVD